VTSIVFLVPRPTTSWDRDRWGFRILAAKGIDARAIDLSVVLRSRTNAGESSGTDIRPLNLEEFSQFVESAAPGSVFIDYLSGIAGPDLRTAPVFKSLREGRALYYVVAAGSLPSAPITRGRLLRATARPGRAARHLASLAARAWAEQFGGYVPPFKVFGPPAPAVTAFAARYGIPADRLIPTHSLDYDGLFRAEGATPAIAPSCVFVDDGLAGHPDFDAPGRTGAEPTKYFETLRRVFDRIEAATGYPVVVAAHPRSNALRSEFVGGREVIRGRTADAVAASVLVLGHASTALGFAALGRKPVILLGGRHVADAGLTSAVNGMAAALGVPVIDPDDAGALAMLSPDLSRIPTEQYARYVAHHVRPFDAPESSLWEVIAQHAVKDIRHRNETLAF
jgi:hypothetical protein